MKARLSTAKIEFFEDDFEKRKPIVLRDIKRVTLMWSIEGAEECNDLPNAVSIAFETDKEVTKEVLEDSRAYFTDSSGSHLEDDYINTAHSKFVELLFSSLRPPDK
jgi:hypothetical protein